MVPELSIFKTPVSKLTPKQNIFTTLCPLITASALIHDIHGSWDGQGLWAE